MPGYGQGEKERDLRRDGYEGMQVYFRNISLYQSTVSYIPGLVLISLLSLSPTISIRRPSVFYYSPFRSAVTHPKPLSVFFHTHSHLCGILSGYLALPSTRSSYCSPTTTSFRFPPFTVELKYNNVLEETYLQI